MIDGIAQRILSLDMSRVIDRHICVFALQSYSNKSHYDEYMCKPLNLLEHADRIAINVQDCLVITSPHCRRLRFVPKDAPTWRVKTT